MFFEETKQPILQAFLQKIIMATTMKNVRTIKKLMNRL